MSWSSSAVFTQWPLTLQSAPGTGYAGLGANTVKAALFGNSSTPNRDAAVTSTGYNTGTWLIANEVSGSSEWVAGGRALTGKTFTSPVAGVSMFDAADLTGTAAVTLSNVYGCLVYDDSITGGTVADQGVSFHYFGGPQTVVAGTFSVLWNSNGIVRFTG